MVTSAVDEGDLLRRIRDRFSTEEERLACVRIIIENKLKVWYLPTLNEVQLLGK